MFACCMEMKVNNRWSLGTFTLSCLPSAMCGDLWFKLWCHRGSGRVTCISLLAGAAVVTSGRLLRDPFSTEGLRHHAGETYSCLWTQCCNIKFLQTPVFHQKQRPRWSHLFWLWACWLRWGAYLELWCVWSFSHRFCLPQQQQLPESSSRIHSHAHLLL